MQNRHLILTALCAAMLPGFGSHAAAAEPTATSLQQRTPIVLSATERELILAEMRDFLQAAQQITAALADDRPQAVAAAARRVGMRAQQAVPAGLRDKLPPAFKQLGADTHQRFDRLAQDAEDLGDDTVTLRQLGELLNNCVACHAAYRLQADPGAGQGER